MNKSFSKNTIHTKKQHFRLLNKDGTFNIDRKASKKKTLSDNYHKLLSLSWTKFLAVIISTYLAVNFIFAILYFAAGPNALEGLVYKSELDRFLESFFFSVQTLATIGYGKVSPSSLTAHILVTLEALMGAMSLALGTGLFFARFAKPTARILFSDVALIANQDGVPALMFRIANARINQVVEAQAHVTLVKNEVTKEGEKFRNLHDLKLEHSRTPIFMLSWTITHPIDSNSPLFHMTKEALQDAEAELLVTIAGTDDTFAQTIHARHSYTMDEIIWGAYFDDMISRNERGLLRVRLDKIHDYTTSP